ncbi:MAG: hypothetical protein ABIZ80_19095 [Bryobacteraceae bacterium]
MSRILVALCLFALLGVAATLESRGIQPHSNRYDYNVTSFTESLAIAATVVPADQVRELFGSGFDRRFIVVEVGFYSKNRSSLEVRQSDFTLRSHPTKFVARPASPKAMEPLTLAAISKSLPEGATAHCVAGYLYFPITAENSHSSRFELDYTGYGTWLTLPLDSMRHRH